MYLIRVLFLYLFPVMAFGQSFVNGDLEGTPTMSISVMAPGWQAVPATDPISHASDLGITDTPDLTSLTGPSPSMGIVGKPYSGITFMSGFESLNTGNSQHEGIMQTVSGLIPDSTYIIGFQMAVVKQSNCLDQSGSWAVFADTTLIGIPASTFSAAAFNDVNLGWVPRTVTFTATAAQHTFKFMPADDDPNMSIGNDITGALRMGIDSIYIKPLVCALPLELGPNLSICQGQAQLLTAPLLDGATYSWQNGFTGNQLVVSAAGTYWVEVSSGGCVARDSVTVNTVPLPQVSLGNDVSACAGDTVLLQAVTGNAALSWFNGSTGPTVAVTQSGNYSVVATANGCSASDFISVQFHALPVVSLGPDTTLCEGSTLLLNVAQPNATYSWSSGSSAPNFTLANPGTFWVSVTRNGCTTSDSISVAFVPLPEVSLGADTSLCEGTPLNLLAVSNATAFLWNTGSTGASLQPTQSGTYWVTATQQGCSRTDSVQVEFREMPQVSLGSYEPVCLGEVITLNAQYNGASYLWQDGSTEASFAAKQSGVYSVVVSLNNCTASSEVTLQFNDCETELIMPNIFTPNNDGVNDLFEPTQAKNLTAAKLRVYNRWGKEIFASDKLDLRWDGRAGGGELVPEGTYLWAITVTHLLGGSSEYKGWVTVVK